MFVQCRSIDLDIWRRGSTPSLPVDWGQKGSVPTLKLEKICWKFLNSFWFVQSVGSGHDDNNDYLFAGGHSCMADL